MATFFLHVRSAGVSMLDTVGSNLPDLQAAREEAERLVLEFVANEVWEAGSAGKNDIEICDLSGERLELVTLKRVLAMPVPSRIVQLIH